MEHQINVLFETQDLWKIVERGFKEPSSPQEEERLTEGERNVLKESRNRDKKVIYEANFEKILMPKLQRYHGKFSTMLIGELTKLGR